MRVHFVERPFRGLERLICDAEIVFEEPGPLWNTKLVGFSLWRSNDGDIYVTFPSRVFGVGPERHFYDYLRSADGNMANIKNVKSWIIAEYRRADSVQPPAVPAAAHAQGEEALS
jgi:hypothetical protein